MACHGSCAEETISAVARLVGDLTSRRRRRPCPQARSVSHDAWLRAELLVGVREAMDRERASAAAVDATGELAIPAWSAAPDAAARWLDKPVQHHLQGPCRRVGLRLPDSQEPLA